VAASYRNKLMALKWKDKRDVYMIISIHDDEMGTIHDKKCGLKQKPKVCIAYNDAMEELIHLITICDVQYNEKKAEEISDLPPLLRFYSFQLISNTQEAWCPSVPYGNNPKVISEVQRSHSP
jgi:hypothetical protein